MESPEGIEKLRPITRFLHTNPRRRGRCNENTKVSSGRVCKPDFVRRACARRDDHSSRPRIASRLKQPTRGSRQRLLRACCVRAGPALPSYLALLHAGFSVPRMLPSGRWALTPPFHPYQMSWTETGGPVVCRRPAAEVFASPAVLFSVALSVAAPSFCNEGATPWRYQARRP